MSVQINFNTLSTSRRPRTLEEVESWGTAMGNVDSFLREFLDEFYVEADPTLRASMLLPEPALTNNVRTNAYLGAVAEHLSLRNDFAIPKWATEPTRFLKRPYFPCGLESLKATLLVESPTAFRRRMIFVGADPLYRPRKDKIGIG